MNADRDRLHPPRGVRGRPRRGGTPSSGHDASRRPHRDEIEPLRDPNVRVNGAYLSVLLLARTVTRVGSVTDITPALMEGLFAADFDHLQRIYERVNSDGDAVGIVNCPHCAQRFEIDMTDVEDERLGMSWAVTRTCSPETARLAHHFHWPPDTILDLEHRDRRLFLAEAEALTNEH